MLVLVNQNQSQKNYTLIPRLVNIQLIHLVARSLVSILFSNVYQYIPPYTSGRPGDDNETKGNPIRTVSGLPGEPVETCRTVEFKLNKSCCTEDATAD